MRKPESSKKDKYKFRRTTLSSHFTHYITATADFLSITSGTCRWVTLNLDLSLQKRLWQTGSANIQNNKSMVFGSVLKKQPRWREHGGSVIECQTPEWKVGGSKPTAAVLCPWARYFTPRKYWLITQEAVAPSRHDWKIVDWDVKPQHKQTNKHPRWTL